MLHLIARIRPDVIRIPLLTVAMPLHVLHYLLCGLLPVKWGGHPDKSRLFEADHYRLLWSIYLAVCAGPLR
jgi:hypothetical protein